jgi:hypothetical protein
MKKQTIMEKLSAVFERYFGLAQEPVADPTLR